MCSYAFCLFLENKSRPLQKANSRQQKNEQRNFSSGVHDDEHREACTPHSTLYTAARTPAACVYFSAFRRMRLTHSAVVSNAYVCKNNVGKLGEETTLCSVKKTLKKGTNRRKSIRRSKQIKGRFSLRGGARAMHPSPLSVIFGVDRGQVLV